MRFDGLTGALIEATGRPAASAVALPPFLRGPERAWSEQLGLSAALLLNAATGPSNLLLALWQGNMVLASVDLVALPCGIGCGYAAWKARPGRQLAPKPVRRAAVSRVPGE